MEQEMQTYSGILVDPIAIKPEQISIHDIAHALAITNRYGGHTKYPFSVAQHSIMVARVLPKHLKLWGLAHDMGEAYIGDLIHSVKIRLPKFKQMEMIIMERLAGYFGLCWPEPPEIKLADNAVLAAECEHFGIRLHSSRAAPPAQGLDLAEWNWHHAEMLFLDEFERLRGASC